MRYIARTTVGIGCCALGLLLATGSAARAADRKVFVEDFTATWCAPCVYAGEALSDLQDNYPNTVSTLQVHVSDSYTLSWGTQRFSSYPNSGSIPNVWFDGTVQHVGAGPGSYNTYYNTYVNRRNDATDVSVELYAEQVSGPTWKFSAVVCLDPTGTAKTVRVYIVRALDHFPNGAHYRNCLREAASTQDVALQPGDCVTVERTMTFAALDWGQQANLRAMAWAQVPLSSGNREIHNSDRIEWPFPAPPAEWELGDMDCSGGPADFGDINVFVLALSNPGSYAATYPDCDMMNGDVDGNGAFDFGDINPFVQLLAGGLMQDVALEQVELDAAN
jgi:hypothetical protein